MTNTTRNVAIGLGVTVTAAGLAWLLWPSDEEEADPKKGASGPPISPTPPEGGHRRALTQFFVRGTTANGSQSVMIERTGDEEEAENGKATILGFKAPNAYAAQSKVWYLQEKALAALTRVQGDLVREWKSAVIVDVYRTLAQQAKIRQEKRHLATARDEDSNHTKGLAVDIRMYDPSVSQEWDINKESTWGSQAHLAQVMARHGWRQLPSEAWHFDYVG